MVQIQGHQQGDTGRAVRLMAFDGRSHRDVRSAVARRDDSDGSDKTVRPVTLTDPDGRMLSDDTTPTSTGHTA